MAAMAKVATSWKSSIGASTMNAASAEVAVLSRANDRAVAVKTSRKQVVPPPRVIQDDHFLQIRETGQTGGGTF